MNWPTPETGLGLAANTHVNNFFLCRKTIVFSEHQHSWTQCLVFFCSFSHKFFVFLSFSETRVCLSSPSMKLNQSTSCKNIRHGLSFSLLSTSPRIIGFSQSILSSSTSAALIWILHFSARIKSNFWSDFKLFYYESSSSHISLGSITCLLNCRGQHKSQMKDRLI